MTRKNKKDTILAAKAMDWQQVVMNGGPPCFYLEDDGYFCGRAEEWVGHEIDEPIHGFVSLDDLLTEFSK